MNTNPDRFPRCTPPWRRATGRLLLAGSSVLVALALGGCASSAGIAPLAQALPASSLGLLPSDAVTPGLSASWWHDLGDPVLDRLIEQALAAQPKLRMAQARVARAAAAVAGVDASVQPRIDAQAGVQRQRFSGNSIYPPPLGGSTLTLPNAQVRGSWELDFFGRNAAALASALGGQRAAEADAAAARSLLASQLAQRYIGLGRLQAQRNVAAAALQQRQDMLGLIRQRVQGGLDSSVELRQGEGALPDTRLQIEQLDEQITLTRHALAALTAQPPDALAALDVRLPALQPLALPTQLPADLLARRADVAAARWRVEAAAGDMRSARADFYPNISLSAFVGLSSIGLGQWLNAGSRELGIGPALHLPIFDAGRLRAQLRGRTAELDAAVESYNQTVIDAVHEAADQIGVLQSLARQQTEQAQAQTAAEAAYAFALQRYRAGLSGYLVVLNAETQVLAQRRQSVDLAARVLDSQILLARALGGGYRDAAAGAAS